MLTRFVVGGILVVLASCGKEEKDYSGSLGSCTQSLSETMIVCTDYTYTVKAEKDPKADVQATLKSSCEEDGTFSATAACSTTGSVGSCTFSSKQKDATVTAVIQYTGADITEEIASTSCSGASGTFAKK